jgi:hypothetical protein
MRPLPQWRKALPPINGEKTQSTCLGHFTIRLYATTQQFIGCTMKATLKELLQIATEQLKEL